MLPPANPSGYPEGAFVLVMQSENRLFRPRANKGSLVGSVHDATIRRDGGSHEESAPLSQWQAPADKTKAEASAHESKATIEAWFEMLHVPFRTRRQQPLP